MSTKAKAAAAAGVALLAVAAWLLWMGMGGDRAAPAGAMRRPPAVVEVATARRERVEETVRAVGNVEAAEQIVVTSQVTGKVAAIHFTEGQRVPAGALLATLEAQQQQAALEAAQTELRDARRQLERFRALETRMAVSEAQLDAAEARLATARARVDEARAAIADRRIVAPFAGTVGLRQVSVGALVQPGTPITTLATTDALKVQFELPSDLLPVIEPGLPLRASAPGFEGVFAGRIARIDNSVDPATRSVAVEGTLKAPDLLKPGVFVALELVVASRPEAVVVPEEAVVLEGERSFVYVVGPERTVERRPVVVGVRRAGAVEIREGLAAGSRVITRGLQQVQPGDPVQLAGEGAGPPRGARAAR